MNKQEIEQQLASLAAETAHTWAAQQRLLEVFCSAVYLESGISADRVREDLVTLFNKQLDQIASHCLLTKRLLEVTD